MSTPDKLGQLSDADFDAFQTACESSSKEARRLILKFKKSIDRSELITLLYFSSYLYGAFRGTCYQVVLTFLDRPIKTPAEIPPFISKCLNSKLRNQLVECFTSELEKHFEFNCDFEEDGYNGLLNKEGKEYLFNEETLHRKLQIFKSVFIRSNGEGDVKDMIIDQLEVRQFPIAKYLLENSGWTAKTFPRDLLELVLPVDWDAAFKFAYKLGISINELRSGHKKSTAFATFIKAIEFGSLSIVEFLLLLDDMNISRKRNAFIKTEVIARHEGFDWGWEISIVFLAEVGYGIDKETCFNRSLDYIIDSCLKINKDTCRKFRWALIQIMRTEGIPEENFLEYFRKYYPNAAARSGIESGTVKSFTDIDTKLTTSRKVTKHTQL